MTRAVRIHQLKIAPKYFNAVVAGQKTAELRKDDRGYKVGDVLSLCEWKHGVFTGRKWAAVISHVLPVNDVMAVSEKWVMLSIRPLTPLEALGYVIAGGAV
ncbi:DUF3850 domain-containing protein [Escherichia coli]|uniref:DUF3850 domain-containing protein n=1 Tax=Escherichia coli TaxID=562 RepID=UPI000BB7D909|nr:DUF3850 domain-containing protein [Escherichia coli]EEZ5779091.1 DUF3850 domain-containing protein [Escherichia coli O40]EFI3644980.1 DUF3850 domain-containing protein [Escherichia coli]EFI4050513.1 DUF3850 domain-containing protein [Escherichia coli]EFI4054534.1 DUF3850 domain-containing protein [Escherichia coli]EFI6233948.1 DUF3850 domain-containing protein [Escherichia coli]